MISQDSLKEFSKKSQARLENIKKEYFQHLFLSSLYQLENSDKLLFKGGTALRLVFGSPRFSEDLDFTGVNIHQYKMIGNLFLEAISEVEKTGIEISFKEAKPTSGGYLGIIHYSIYNSTEDLKFEISLRKGKEEKYEIITLVNDYIGAYPVICLPAKEIVNGKISALLERGKPRDYYDLYFILRHPKMRQFVNTASLKLVLKQLQNTKINFKEELLMLLPVSHQILLKTFKEIIREEIIKNLA